MKSTLFRIGKFVANKYGFEVKNNKTKPIINEAINLEKEVIFIAIPKTGTTSVRSQLAQKGEPIIKDPHLNICQIKELIYIHCLKDALKTNIEFPSKVNHLSDSDVRRKAKELYNNFFKFSAVRNPWSRAVSLYFRNEGIKKAGKMTFDEFIYQHKYASDTCIHPTFHKNQIDWLCDKNGKTQMDFIYKVEDFSNAINKIFELTDGRLKLVDVKENLNPKSKSKNYQSMYRKSTREVIAKHFEKDIDLFKYSF